MHTILIGLSHAFVFLVGPPWHHYKKKGPFTTNWTMTDCDKWLWNDWSSLISRAGWRVQKDSHFEVICSHSAHRGMNYIGTVTKHSFHPLLYIHEAVGERDVYRRTVISKSFVVILLTGGMTCIGTVTKQSFHPLLFIHETVGEHDVDLWGVTSTSQAQRLTVSVV